MKNKRSSVNIFIPKKKKKENKGTLSFPLVLLLSINALSIHAFLPLIGVPRSSSAKHALASDGLFIGLGDLDADVLLESGEKRDGMSVGLFWIARWGTLGLRTMALERSRGTGEDGRDERGVDEERLPPRLRLAADEDDVDKPGSGEGERERLPDSSSGATSGSRRLLLLLLLLALWLWLWLPWW